MTENKEHKELCLLYQNATANIDLLKKSQWQVYVFYSAIAAALISKDNLINDPFIKVLISLLLFIGVITVEFYQAHFRLDMIKYRKILVCIYERFGESFREIRDSAKGQKKAELNDFEILFRHGGCGYIFVVFSLTINKLWPDECKSVCAALVFQSLIMISAIVLVIFFPFGMKQFVDYIDKKHRTDK